MERNAEGREMLQRVAKQIGPVTFLLMTHFLVDAVNILGLLSLSMQKENVTYATAKPQIDAAVVALQSMVTTPGPYLKQ